MLQSHLGGTFVVPTRRVSFHRGKDEVIHLPSQFCSELSEGSEAGFPNGRHTHLIMGDALDRSLKDLDLLLIIFFRWILLRSNASFQSRQLRHINSTMLSGFSVLKKTGRRKGLKK